MFQNIYLMYHKINNEEESDSDMIITSMSENIEENKQNGKVEDSKGKVNNNKNLLQNMNMPSDLKKIQPIPTQICNCDEIGLDTNENWNIVLSSYKLFTGEIIWKLQTGERAQLWFT